MAHPHLQTKPTNPQQILRSKTTGLLYLRFPYNPHIVKFINENLPACTYVEGTVDSAPHPDGRPTPFSSKPMLYKLAGSSDSIPLIRQLTRAHSFSVSPSAIVHLRELAAEYRQNQAEGVNTVAPVSEGDLIGAVLSATPSAPPPKQPAISGLTGRRPETAGEITALKIQTPRVDDNELLLTGAPASTYERSYEGLYDNIMGFPGAEWVKGKKGQSRGYFRVEITHDTPAMVKVLNSRYELSLSPELPRAIAQRIGKLHRDIRLSRTSSAELRLPVPEGLDYLPYQKAGIAYAVRKGNALIADEPGLGKTIQAIGVSNCIKAIRSVLIVVPASLKINWEREWQKWCVKGLTTGSVKNGQPDSWPKDAQGNTPNVVIINFDLVDKHKARLTATTWDLMIVDEAHALKNDAAKRTQLILGKGTSEPGLPRHRTLLLTGTPILSRPKELWTLAHALDPEYFSNRLRFALRYCNAHETKHGWNMDGSSNLGELQRELRARIMVRRKKADVLKELPPKTRQIIPLENGLATLRETHVLKMAAKALQDIQRERRHLDPLNERTYRAEAARLTDMENAVFEQLSKQRKDTALLKVPQVMELVEQALDGGSGKLIIFAHHREVVEAYRDAINSLFLKRASKGKGRSSRQATEPDNLALVYGPTPKDKRQTEVDRFQADPKCKVFLGSIGAAGVGWTLTQANIVLFAEMDWVPGIISQAEDRAHRIGQFDNVLVWHAVVDGSIDARMVRRLIEKQRVIDAALDHPQAMATQAPPAKIRQPECSEEDQILDRYLAHLDSQIDRQMDSHSVSVDDDAHTMAQAMSDTGDPQYLPLRIG